MVRDTSIARHRLPPPSEEDRRRAAVVLKGIRQRREALLARNGGRLFSDSTKIVRELRAERDDELA